MCLRLINNEFVTTKSLITDVLCVCIYIPDKGDTHLVIEQGDKMDSCYILKETNVTSSVSHLAGQVSCPLFSVVVSYHVCAEGKRSVERSSR